MFNIKEVTNESEKKNKVLTTETITNEFIATVTFFKETGKYYTDIELVVQIEEDTNTYDLMNAIEEHILARKNFKEMTAVVTTPDNHKLGHPVLIHAK